MAIYPGAVWRPIPEAEREPLITATQVILHTAVSNAESLYAYWAREDVVLESHFYVGQHTVEQYVNTARQADANFHANVRAVSIETWDGRDPEHTPWTAWQLDALTELVAWCCRTHGVPARFCPAWDQPGIGWHTMWGAPSPWTPVQKTCPGAPRVAQMPELLSRVQSVLSPQPAPTPPLEEDEMFLYTAPGRPVFFCSAGKSVGLNEASDVPTFVEAHVPKFNLDDDTFAKFRERYPGT